MEFVFRDEEGFEGHFLESGKVVNSVFERKVMGQAGESLGHTSFEVLYLENSPNEFLLVRTQQS